MNKISVYKFCIFLEINSETAEQEFIESNPIHNS